MNGFLDLEHCKKNYEMLKDANQRNIDCRYKALEILKPAIAYAVGNQDDPDSELLRKLLAVKKILENP